MVKLEDFIMDVNNKYPIFRGYERYSHFSGQDILDYITAILKLNLDSESEDTFVAEGKNISDMEPDLFPLNNEEMYQALEDRGMLGCAYLYQAAKKITKPLKIDKLDMWSPGFSLDGIETEVLCAQEAFAEAAEIASRSLKEYSRHLLKEEKVEPLKMHFVAGQLEHFSFAARHIIQITNLMYHCIHEYKK
ncbi:hypothetical protein KY339_04750 [Candidatus Woesearchaeota archaeon]|nr:hypothetical protein [Candidatus Woesearchaeota archaeon]